MAYSYNEVGAISPGQTISVPFGFISRDHVRVLVDGVVSTEYSWSNDGLLTATDGFPSGTVTRVERNTPVALLKAVLAGTAVFDWDGVNANFRLLLYILQEYVDKEDFRNDKIAIVLEAVGTIQEAAAAAQEAAESAGQDAAAGAAAAIAEILGQIQEAAGAAQQALDDAQAAAQQASTKAGEAAASAEEAATFDPSAYYTKTEMDAQLGSNGRRNLTISSEPPSGGADGDIWYQV